MAHSPGATMRLGIPLEYSRDLRDAADEVVAAERVGVDLVSVSEAYSADAVSRLGYLAAVTERMTLAAGILPLFSRTPTLVAMTAVGLDELSGGRFELGLGASGPQVIEGFHGVPYRRPLSAMRETIEICRQVWRRDPVIHDGREFRIPLPADEGTGLGKPLKIITHPVRERIPIAVAALAAKAVAQAAELAEGWIPLFYWPERADGAWGAALADGLERRDPALGPLDVQASAPLLIGDDVDAALARHRAHLALYVGGMGARGANFYNDLAVRYDLGDAAATVQELYLGGRKEEAAAALPDEFVAGTALIGSAAHVAERIAAYRAAGVTTLLVEPMAGSRDERLEHLGAVRALLDA